MLNNDHDDISVLYSLAFHFLTTEEQSMLKEYMRYYYNTFGNHVDAMDRIDLANVDQERYTLTAENGDFSQVRGEE